MIIFHKMQSVGHALARTGRMRAQDWQSFEHQFVDPYTGTVSTAETAGRQASGTSVQHMLCEGSLFGFLCNETRPVVVEGNRGQGKSTLFGGLERWTELCNENSRVKTLVVYVDTRQVSQSIDSLDPLLQKSAPDAAAAIEVAIFWKIFDAILEALNDVVPLRTTRTILNRLPLWTRQDGTDVTHTKATLEDFRNRNRKLLNSFVEVSRGSTTQKSKVRLLFPIPIFFPYQIESEKIELTAVAAKLEELVDELNKSIRHSTYKNLCFCFDDFSMIPQRAQTVIMAALNRMGVLDPPNSVKIATYIGRGFGDAVSAIRQAKGDGEFPISVLTVDQFARHRTKFHELRTMDALRSRHLTEIVARRLGTQRGSDEWLNNLPRGQTSAPLSLTLFYGASGLPRHAGRLLVAVSEQALPVDHIEEADLCAAAIRLFNDDLDGKEHFHFSQIKSEDVFLSSDGAASLAVARKCIFDAVKAKALCCARYFHSSIIVERGRDEEILALLANVGYVMKRVECGGTPPSEDCVLDHRYAIYSLNFGYVLQELGGYEFWDRGALLRDIDWTRFIELCRASSSEIRELLSPVQISI